MQAVPKLSDHIVETQEPSTSVSVRLDRRTMEGLNRLRDQHGRKTVANWLKQVIRTAVASEVQADQQKPAITDPRVS